MYHQTGTDYYSNTKVTYRRNAGLLERVGQSAVGVFIGLALIAAGSYAIFWNEGRAVQTDRSLNEGMNVVLSIGDGEVVFPSNNGKLIHFSAIPEITKSLQDEDYGIKVNAIKLNKQVEMYQWHEEEHVREINEGSETRKETTYSYHTSWNSELVNSANFYKRLRHENPKSFKVASKKIQHREVRTGKFMLSKGLIEQVDDFKPMTENMMKSIRLTDTFHRRENSFYHSDNPSQPMVGDFRVTFTYAGAARLTGEQTLQTAPVIVSVLSSQNTHDSLESYKTKAGDDIEHLVEEEMSAKGMFEKAHSANNARTWMLRGFCWLTIFIGFVMSTNIVNALVSWVPILREIVSLGMIILNLTLSLSLTVSLTAVAWIRYRPLVGGAVLALLAVSIFSVSKWSKKKKETDRVHFE